MQGDRNTVKSLLQQKPDVNAPQGDGATALHWAASNEDLEMVKLLLAAGANVNAATRDGGVTPLFMACSAKRRRERQIRQAERNHCPDDRRRIRQRECHQGAARSRRRNQRQRIRA
jgi:ankyrin repeat protein